MAGMENGGRFSKDFKMFAGSFLPLQLQGEVAEGRRGFPEAEPNPHEMGLCGRPGGPAGHANVELLSKWHWRCPVVRRIATASAAPRSGLILPLRGPLLLHPPKRPGG